MIRYRVIGVMYTRTCPLACRHCITESSPAARGRMTVAQARRYIPAIARFAPHLSFTGGEALLYYRDILELAQDAVAAGLEVSVVSGAGWVKGDDMARSRVRELRAAGVSRMVVSWDVYHEEYAAREKALLLVRLACEAGMQVSVRTVVPAGHGRDEYHAPFKAFPVQVEATSPARLGAARNLPDSHFSSLEAPPKGSCEVVRSPAIEPDGSVFACCGPSHFTGGTSPLRLGNAEEEPLEDILARGVADPILEAINLIGPCGLYELLRRRDNGSPLPALRSRYTSICELCLDLNASAATVAALRRRLQDTDAQMMLAAARMWTKRKPRRHPIQVPFPGTDTEVGTDAVSHAG